MKTLSAFDRASMLLLLAAGCAAPVEDDLATVSDVAANYEEFRDGLLRDPGADGMYLLDGDLRATEPQVREFYDTYVAPMELPAQEALAPDVGRANGELVLNRVPTEICTLVQIPPLPPFRVCAPSAVNDVWGASRSNLTFCISNSFSRAEKIAVANAMQVASNAWERAAGVRFVYVPSQDAGCDTLAGGGPPISFNPSVQFGVVRDSLSPLSPSSSEALFGATATYPSTPRPNRQVRVHALAIMSPILPTVMNPALPTIMTHVLGHALGFRHEHIVVSQLTAGSECTWDSGGLFTQLTATDPSSIMHYFFCNGANASSGGAITALDAAGASSVYGPPLPPHPCAHTPALAGGALEALCSVPVASVCSFDPFCCTTAWDSFCVDEVVPFI